MAHINGVEDRGGNNTLWSQHLMIFVVIRAQGSNPKLTRSRQQCTSTKGHLADRAFQDIRQQREGPEPLNYHDSVTQLSVWRERSCAKGDGQCRPRCKLFVDILIGALTATQLLGVRQHTPGG
jgi:hypothetical protein